MATIPSAGHISDSLRTEGEVKADLEAVIASLRQVPGSAAVELAATISGGSITPAGGGGIIVVDTESAAATDDLANIIPTNYPDNACILLRNANAARVVTLKHGATGTGQMFLDRSADLVLADTQSWVMLQRRGNDWYEVWRSPSVLRAPCVSKTASFTVQVADHGKVFVCSGAGIVISLLSAATYGNGFTFGVVNNDGLGNELQIDPAGVETIDGTTLMQVIAERSLMVACDGSGKFFSLAGFVKELAFRQTFATSISVNALVASYQEVNALTANITSLTLNNGRPGMRLRLRFKQDGTGGRTVAAPSGAKITGSLSGTANQASILDLSYSELDARWEGNWINLPT